MSIRSPFVSLALTLVFAACSPGELDPSISTGGATQTGGKTGGAGGSGGTGGSDMPAECGDLGVAKLDDFDTKFIVPRCGQVMCHGPSSVFPPRNLDMPGMIRTNTVGKKATLACKTDFYINKTKPADSFMLHKITAEGTTMPCPSDPGGKADAGGTRMPNKDKMPTIPGDRLTDGEIKCFTWWVESVAKL
jgi:hypothetical protein